MISRIRKLLIPSLSIMLILSNFSFVASYSICSMGSMKENCGCKNVQHPKASGVEVSKVKKACCEEKIIELSNSNILSIDKPTKVSCDEHQNCFLINNDLIPDFSGTQNNQLSYPDKIPKDGIPITVSSLRI